MVIKRSSAMWLLFVCGIVGLAVWLGFGFRTRTGTGVDASTANARIHHRFQIPTEASDVNFESSVWFSIADFAISREQFIAWTNSRNWRVTKVDDSQAFIPASRDEPKLVESGLQFDERDGDFGYYGIYDDDLNRASISFSTR